MSHGLITTMAVWAGILLLLAYGNGRGRSTASNRPSENGGRPSQMEALERTEAGVIKTGPAAKLVEHLGLALLGD